jgi:hypothetical protein
VASCARLYWVSVLAKPSLEWYANIEVLVIWSGVEPAMGISAASLATLRPLLRIWSQKMKEWRAAKPNSKLRRVFAPRISTNQKSYDSSKSAESQPIEMPPISSTRPSASGRSFEPLNTWEAPDFLETHDPNSSDEEHAGIPRGYIQFNATPRLAPDDSTKK